MKPFELKLLPALSRFGCSGLPRLSRPARVGVLVGLIVYLGVLDLFLTQREIGRGGFHEGNPVARWLVEATGRAESLTALKGLSLVVGCGLLLGLRRYAAAETAAWGFAVFSVLLGVLWVLHLEGVEYSLAFGPLKPGGALAIP